MFISDVDLAKLAQLTQQFGWTKGLENFMSALSARQLGFIRSELSKRYMGWVCSLDGKHKTTALVLESGLGSCSLALSERFHEVVVVCIDESVANIVRERAVHLEKKNIKILCGIDGLSELEQGSIEVIVCIDDGEKNVIDQNLLQLFSRILSSRGQFALVTACDSQVSRWKRSTYRKTYQDTLHLLDLFFPRKDIYRCIGQYCRHVFRIKKIHNEQERSVRFSLRGYVAVIRDYFFGGKFLIVGGRELPEASFFDYLLQEISTRYCAGQSLCIESVVMSKPRGALLLVEAPDSRHKYVVRLAYDVLTRGRYETNSRMLESISRLELESTLCVPEYIGKGIYEGLHYTVESRLPGANISPAQMRKRHRLDSIVQQSIDGITTLNLASSELRLVDKGQYSSLIEEPLSRGENLFGISRKNTFEIIRGYLRRSLYGVRLPLVIYHGDCSLDNILISQKTDQVQGLFDWDYSKRHGLPLIDIIFLIASYIAKTKKISLSGSVSYILAEMDNELQTKRFIHEYCKTMNLKEELAKPLIVVFVVNLIAYRMEMDEEYAQPAYYESMFGQLLNDLEGDLI